MLALVLLLLPLIHSAPPLRSHAHPPPCDTTICRVSDQSLDSALSTFLCFTEKKYSAMEEVDKKRELAAAIAPYLDGFLEEELVAMDSESLVSLVNLVLYAGSDKVVKKTELQHFEDLISSVAIIGFGLTPEFFRNVDPIVLCLINCQSMTIAEIHELVAIGATMVAPMAGEDRDGRMALFNKLQDQIMRVFKNLPSLPGEPDLPAMPEKTTSMLEVLGKLMKEKGVPPSLPGESDIPAMPEKTAMQEVLGKLMKEKGVPPSLPGEPDIPAMPEKTAMQEVLGKLMTGESDTTSPEEIASLQEVLRKLMEKKGVTTPTPTEVEPTIATTTDDYGKDFLGFVTEILSEVSGMPDIDVTAMSEAGNNNDKDAINKMLDDVMAVALPA